tara:strand:+ start:1022 stop:1432 length:411 start_codon:yes stop_codon:yes gene_type:complete
MNNKEVLPSFTSRFLCGIYDFMLLIGVWFFVGSIVFFVNGMETLNPYLGILIAFVSAWGFFAFFWMNGGQTLGMKVWTIKIKSTNGNSILLYQTIIRFLVNCIIFLTCGLLLILINFNVKRLSVSDYLSKTKLIKI